LSIDGIHSLSSPSHISLILYKTFNVSIPLENIPQDRYSFEEAAEIEDAAFETEGVAQLSGRWKDKRTNRTVGADKEEVGFVVTG
jgi:DNA-directed RNA polymerase I subunit RPA43